MVILKREQKDAGVYRVCQESPRALQQNGTRIRGDHIRYEKHERVVFDERTNKVHRIVTWALVPQDIN